jgi:hypothetical protein
MYNAATLGEWAMNNQSKVSVFERIELRNRALWMAMSGTVDTGTKDKLLSFVFNQDDAPSVDEVFAIFEDISV